MHGRVTSSRDGAGRDGDEGGIGTRGERGCVVRCAGSWVVRCGGGAKVRDQTGNRGAHAPSNP